LKKELIFVDTNVVVWFLKGRPGSQEQYTDYIRGLENCGKRIA